MHKLGSLSAFVLQVGSGTIASLANCIHRCKSPCVSVVVFFTFIFVRLFSLYDAYLLQCFGAVLKCGIQCAFRVAL